MLNGVPSQDRASLANRKQLRLSNLALFTEGVLTIPGSDDFFLSFVHTQSDIDEIIDTAAQRELGPFSQGGTAQPIGPSIPKLRTAVRILVTPKAKPLVSSMFRADA